MPKRVLIIGSGIIGLSAAHYLTQFGHRVTIIERDGPETLNCSFGNAGLVCPSHFIPLAFPGMMSAGLRMMLNPESAFYVKPRLSWSLIDWAMKFKRAATAEHVSRAAPLLRDMHFASRALYEELARFIDFGLATRGLLMLCKTQKALDEESHVAHRALELGVPAEILDAKQTAALDPNAKTNIVGSIYYPKDCHLFPNQLIPAFRAHLQTGGVQFHWRTQLTGWRVESNIIKAAQTTAGDISADEYVLAAGSWSPQCASDLKLNLPMQAGKGYSLTLANPPQLPSLPTILAEAHVAVTPMGASLRFGGTMEIAGLDLSITHSRVNGIIRAACEYYPDFTEAHFQNITPWAGLRPVTPDGLPYVGRTRRYTNLTLATGHAMLGISLGPITGKLVAQLLSGERPDIDITLLHPERFN